MTWTTSVWEMTDLMHRAGRICADNAWIVVILWVLVAISLAIGIRLFGAQTDNDLSLPGTGSQDATDVLAQRFPPQQNGTSPIVFYTPDGKLTDKQHKPAMKDAVAALKKAPDVYSVISPVSSKGQTAGLISKDKATGYAPVLLDHRLGTGGRRPRATDPGRRARPGVRRLASRSRPEARSAAG